MARIVWDNFDRVSMTPGVSTSGHTWNVISGAWDVDGGTIGETNGADSMIVLLNTGITDTLTECRFWNLGGMKAGQILARANSTGTTLYNLDVWTDGSLRINKNIFTTVGSSTAAGIFTEGALVSFRVTEEASLTRLRAYLNGTEVLNVTDNAAGRPSGTYVGFRHASGNTNYFVRMSQFQVRNAADSPNDYPAAPTSIWGQSWYRARQNKSIRPARIAWVGDSIFEGWGATTRPNRPAQKFLDLVRTAYNGATTGGEGYIPTYYIHSQSWKNAFVKTGTITDGILYGLGKRHYQWANTATCTLTVTGSHVDIYWRGGGGTFTWRVDGGATTSVNTAANANDASMEGRRTRITFGSTGSHTVTLARTAGTVTIEGAVVYNGDLTSGFNLLDWSHSGFYSADHGTHGFTTTAPHMRDFQPSLVVMELVGANDYLWNNTTPAANATNVQNLLNRYLALPSNPDVALVIPRITSAPNAGTNTWNQYADLVAAITHTRIKLVDLRSNTGVTLADGVHPNDAGHAAMAQAVFNAVNVVPTLTYDPNLIVGGTEVASTWSVMQAGVEVSAVVSVMINNAETPLIDYIPPAIHPNLIAEYGFNEGTGTTSADSSGNNRTIALNNAVWEASGKTGTAIKKISTTVNAGARVTGFTAPSAAATIMGWIYPLDLTSGSTRPVFGFVDDSGNSQFIVYAQRGDFGTPNVLQGNARIGGTLRSLTGGARTLNAWVHVAMTYDGSALRLLINGVTVSQASYTGTITAGTYFSVADSLSSYISHCVVDDVRVFNAGLTDTEIAGFMNDPV